jgi:hypothetical protein
MTFAMQSYIELLAKSSCKYNVSRHFWQKEQSHKSKPIMYFEEINLAKT